MSPWGMVSQTRLDYGSGGYQAPAILHFPRSVRGKRSARKKVEDNPLCAFDLLATVAGKLLLERENSMNRCNNSGTSILVATTNTIKPEQVDEEKPFEAFDRLSCNEDLLGPENVLKKSIKNTFEEHTREISSEPPSVLAKSEISNEGTIDVELNRGRKENFDAFAGTYALGRPCSSSVDSHGSKDGSKTLYQAERRIIGGALDENAPCIYSSDDGMDLDTKPPVLVSSDSSVEVPPCRNNNISYNISFPKREGLEDLSIDKDDDESSSRCTHPTVVTNKASRLQRIGDRRIRKLLASKFWKLAPTRLQDEMKPALQCKRPCYTRQRTQRSSFKRRKLFDHCSVPVCDRRTYSEDMPNLCEKGGVKLERNDSHATLCDETGASTSTSGQEFYGSPDYQVKLSIKFFKVPELVIEIPETSTVGSLKRTVMEAVTAILGDGLRVGVLLHGKKVRNDKKTLSQVGISHSDKLDNLGFALEPISRQGPAPPTSSSEDPDFLSLGCTPEPLSRIPPIAPAVVGQGLSDAIPQPFSTFPGSDHDSARPPTETVLPKKTTANSLALVAVCPMNVEALTMVPLRNKPKRTEVAQRRVRRPFSVGEVEALVQAVEKLGTGRWRDVKLCAFENAKHRTYVDLKDKWKTLVHTAQISPQQRRGEPVPQELLDRVLTAHAYWTQQHVKLQLKPPPPGLPPPPLPPAEQPELCQLL